MEPLLVLSSKRGPKHGDDLRHVVDAMLSISHTGCQRSFRPEEFGPWTRIWSQFRRWSRNVDADLLEWDLQPGHRPRPQRGHQPGPPATEKTLPGETFGPDVRFASVHRLIPQGSASRSAR
ncbi:MAG: transposase, partial [Acidimicrobiaceae bacterium]|nr:transposase [Acidimicrobiaceae bacterium]